ncbi:MAG: hypothetical protein WBE76_27425 [Terracidiphilus sp.]
MDSLRGLPRYEVNDTCELFARQLEIRGHRLLLPAKNKREHQYGNHSREEDEDPFGWFSRFAWNIIGSSPLAKEDAIVSHYRGDVADLQNDSASAQRRC